MKVHDEHLSKEEKQVVADEAAATERAKQAEQSKGVHPPTPVGGGPAQQAAVGGRPAVPAPAPSKEGPAAVGGFKPPKEVGPAPVAANPAVVAPAGAKILREVAVGGLTHCYVIGLAPEYAGSALWMVVDAGTTREEVERDMDRRLRRA